jgi:protein-L-isoaspartate(D-aspartate) O-methyltransferase
MMRPTRLAVQAFSGCRLAVWRAHSYKRRHSHHDEPAMDRAAQAFAAARNRMVDSQVRPNKVTDSRIIAAMRQLPRERFVPPALAALAYADDNVPLGGGRVLVEPMVIARLVQLAAVIAGDRALVVASGTGYGAALLAACGARVTALEEVAPLLAIARSILPELAPGVSLVSGPLAAGWPPGAPYDVVLIEGAVRDVPAAIGEQLHKETGRLVTVCMANGTGGQAMLAEATTAGLRMQPMFDCATPPIPGLVRSAGFVF